MMAAPANFDMPNRLQPSVKQTLTFHNLCYSGGNSMSPSHQVPPRYQFQILDVRSLGISMESIQLLAHRLFEIGGRKDGQSFNHWVEAERQLVAQYIPRPARRRCAQAENQATATPAKHISAPDLGVVNPPNAGNLSGSPTVRRSAQRFPRK